MDRATAAGQTLVSGLWDLERRERIGRRSVDEYRRHAQLVLDVELPLVVYVDEELEEWVADERAQRGLTDITRVVPRPLETLPYFDLGWASAELPTIANDDGRSTVRHEIIQWSKFPLVVETIGTNPFATEHFAWIDFGVGHVAHPPVTFPAPSDAVAVLQMRAVAASELVDEAAYYGWERGRIAGGFIRASGERFRDLTDAFDAELRHALTLGLRPNEQMVLGALSVKRPELFTYYYGDYSSILVNWDAVRDGLDVVLLNARHCRTTGLASAGLDVCLAALESVERGTLAPEPDELAELLDECIVAAWSGRRFDLSYRAGALLHERCTSSRYYEQHCDRIENNLSLPRPTVSVVIPVHNGEATIERAIRSALGQTFRDLEVVVVDDCSTDGTAGIVRRLAREDARVQLVQRTENYGGPARPRDDGIAASTGRFIALLDHDDWWLPDKLRRQLPLFTSPDIAVVYSRARFEEEDGTSSEWPETATLPQGDLRAQLAAFNVVPVLTAVIRREWIDRVGRFDKDSIVGSDDYYYWLRVSLAGGQFAGCDDVLAVYSVHAASMSRARRVECLASVERVRRLVQRDYPAEAETFRVGRNTTIALCMIVRNEAAVIERCIDSVRPLIDTWVICDTGSDDETPKLVEEALAGIPGTLHHRPWRDFGTNRTELFELAEGAADYLLLLDADQTVRWSAPWPVLAADAYLVRHEEAVEYSVPRLVRNGRPWRFEGVTHEHLACAEPFTTEPLPQLTVVHHADGGSRADKFERDRTLLELQLEAHPDDARTVFYLAQTYRDAGDGAKAIAMYRRRTELDGWDEEAFYAAFQLAVLVATRHFSAGLPLLFDAWERRPHRAEPLYEIAVRARNSGQYHLAHLVTSLGVDLPIPGDILFVHRWVYEWGMRFEHSIASAHVGELSTAVRLTDELLASTSTPEHLRADLLLNRQWCADQLAARDEPVPAVGRVARDSGALPPLTELVPSVRITRLANDLGAPWTTMNPSIAADGDGFLAIVRAVNYRMVDGSWYQLPVDDQAVRTRNLLVRYTGDLTPSSSVELHEPAEPRRHPTRVQGFEDCRLFKWRDEWHVTATSRDLEPDELCRMVLLRVDGDQLTDLVELAGPDPGRHEKNWMPFVVGDDLCFVYGCHPFVVLRWDPAARSLVEVQRHDTPASMAGFRGGSQGLQVDGGVLFAVHESVVSNRRRLYVHRLLLANDDLVPVAMSRQFAFLHNGVEFCAGMARHGDDVVLSLGVDDRVAVFATAPFAELMALLEPL